MEPPTAGMTRVVLQGKFVQVDYYYGRGAWVLTPITFLAVHILLNYCMTCAEGLHFSAFHWYGNDESWKQWCFVPDNLYTLFLKANFATCNAVVVF